MKSYFDHKVVWITGASSGIGESLVIALAAKSKAKIILSSRNVNQLTQVAQKAKLDRDRFMILPIDLEDYQKMSTMAVEAVEHFGKIDILINNAGVSQRSFAMDTDIEVDKRLMNIDYIGTVALTKAILPHMIANNGGHIVVVSSLMGIFSAPMRSSYAAAKHALHGFFDALRAELYTQKIAITIICPGYIQTNISVNALTGNGDAQGTMDEATQNGMHVDAFVHNMLSAIAKKKKQAVIGGKEVVGVYLKRFLPNVLAKTVRKAKVV